MIIYVGSQNKAKVKAVEIALAQIKERQNNNFTAIRKVEGVNVLSGVSGQPKYDEETIQGALNRCQELKDKYPDSICIGLEGGVQETAYGLLLCNWGVLMDQEGNRYIAGGARIPLPESVTEGIRQGKELGEVIEDYAQKSNIRQNEGAIGILSNGLIDRPHMFAEVVLLLLGQMLHYSESKIYDNA
jgi:inosine/xanthosine triphosphatase